jgi:hypothetical protein
MNFFFILCVIGMGVAVFMLIYKYFSGKQMVATDDMYSQRDVTIDYKAGTIAIKKHSYPVNHVTGIAVITQTNGNRSNYHVQIEMDDMRKPIHKIPVIGSKKSAEEFMQRICVALRKAGGPSFS